jgi:hypothetical protein
MPRLSSLSERSETWLLDNPCPPDEDGAPCINDWIFDAARAFKYLSEEMACSMIYGALTRAPKTPNEVERAVWKVRNSTWIPNGSPAPKGDKPKYNPDLLAKYAARVPFDVTEDWLAEVSPECVLDVSPSDFLSQLYEPGESVCIIDLPNAKKTAIWRHGHSADSLDQFTRERQNVWFLSNPVTGTEINGSWRSERNVTSWRYGVLESDEKHISDLWLRALVQLRLPISAIYASGGKSVHALFRVDADTKAEWDSLVRHGENSVMSQLVRIGADPGALKAVQLTRLPNCLRGETGRLQKLLYLNPEPEQKPIYAKTRYT